MIRVITHSHTCFSADGFITPRTLVKHCQRECIDCVCITDHNLMHGAVAFAKTLPLRIVIGQEISTTAGDIIGLFMSAQIPAGLPLDQAVQLIKDQGALVYLPHPFDEFRDSSVKFADAQRIKDRINIVEIFNSRTFNAKYNALAADFAKANNIAIAVGCDAHHPLELANAYMQMEDFDSPQSFLASLRKATYVAQRCSFPVRLYIKALKIITGKN